MASYSEVVGKKATKIRASISVTVNGKVHRQAKSFATRKAAEAWAKSIEDALEASGNAALTTLRALLEKYAAEVSAKRKGGDKEAIRIKTFIERNRKLADRPARDITSQDWRDWINARKRQEVKGGQRIAESTVRREVNILSGAYEEAVKNWDICDANPFRKVAWPQNAKQGRKVPVSDADFAAICEHLDAYAPDVVPSTPKQFVGAAFYIALGTAMRRGEMMNLCWRDVDLKRHKVYLHDGETKSDKGRRVPMTEEVEAVFRKLWEARDEDSQRVFHPIIGRSAYDYFRQARVAAGLPHIRIHDCRHEAASRLARIMSLDMLRRITGHADTKILEKHYVTTLDDDLVDAVRVKRAA